MPRKARVGIILLRSRWFEKLVIQDALSDLNHDRDEIVQKLEPIFEIGNVWSISSMENLEPFQREFPDLDDDLVLLVYQTRVEELRLEPILSVIKNKPMIVWCYLPWRRIPHPLSFEEFLRTSGPSSSLAIFGMLKNLKVPFLATFGSPDDPGVRNDFITFGQAAQVHHDLAKQHLGVICDHAEGVVFDTVGLASGFGISVTEIPTRELETSLQKIEHGAVENYLSKLEQLAPDRMVTDETIYRAARTALAYADLSQRYNLDLLAFMDHDAELKKIAGICPGLPPDPLGENETVFLSTLDSGAVIADTVVKLLTGKEGFFLQVWFWDKARNLVVGGSTGLQSSEFADPGHFFISGDYECSREDPDGGAQMEFVTRPGRVTLLQVQDTPNGWKAIATAGICLESDLWAEGVPQAIVRLDCTVERFLETLAEVGSTQNWILTYGSFLPELKAFFEIKGIEFHPIF